MGKIDELIQQYCPDGVEYVPIGDYLSYEQPTRYLVESTKYDDSYTTPVLTAGQSFILGYTKETSGIFDASRNNPVIIFDDFTTSFHWVEFSFKVKSSAMKMLRPTNESKALFRYLYHCMKNVQYVPGDHTRQWIGTYSQFEIPLPPLPIQEEIVSILDNFTNLAAELQARQQQYEYYRDTLLSFEGREDVDYLAIPMFVELKAGKAIKAEELKEQTDEEHKYPCYGGNGVRGYIGKQSHNGDYPIIWRQGALCGCVNWASGEFYATEHAVVCKPLKNANSKFIYYLFQTANLNQYKSQGAQPGLSVQRLNELVFPVPSLAEQQRIVDILDRFDTLVNDLSQGLPAEIEARQQQYEYYRDQLLTFKRKKA